MGDTVIGSGVISVSILLALSFLVISLVVTMPTTLLSLSTTGKRVWEVSLTSLFQSFMVSSALSTKGLFSIISSARTISFLSILLVIALFIMVATVKVS